jgi:hypothetical protein
MHHGGGAGVDEVEGGEVLPDHKQHTHTHTHTQTHAQTRKHTFSYP